MGDKRRLLQTLVSLIQNAINQTPTGSIQISALYESLNS